LFASGGKQELRRPLLGIAAMWITGSAAALNAHRFTWIWLSAGALLLCICGMLWKKLTVRSAAVLLMALLVAFGYTAWTEERNRTEIPLDPNEIGKDGKPVLIKGTIASSVELDGDRADFVLTAARFAETVTDDAAAMVDAWININERVKVIVKLRSLEEQAESRAWKRGDQAGLACVLQTPASGTNFGAFDYRRYLHFQRIHWLLQCDGMDGIRVHGPGKPSIVTLLRWNDEWRMRAGERIAKLFPAEQAGFMKGLLIGLRDDLEPERYQQFAQLGLSHVLAISGLHVAVFIGICTGLLRLLRIPRETSITLVMLLIPFYIVFSGSSPSVVRAGLMAMIGLYAVRSNRWKDGLNLICLTALIMLVWDPYYLTNISFQLSFAVTAGLIAGVPRFSRLLPLRPRWLASLLAVSIVAEFVSFPLSIYYFNQYSLLSLPANLLLVSLISSIVLPSGLAAVAADVVFPVPAQGIAAFTSRLNHFVFAAVEQLNRVEGALTIWPTPSPLWIAAYYAVLGLALASWTGKADVCGFDSIAAQGRSGRWIRTAASVLFISLLLYAYVPDVWDRTGKVSFIDVGQGDSILIRTPERRVLLIDGGGTVRFPRKPGEEWKERRDPFEVGRKVLVPLLKQRGVRRIDALIVTHLDADHIGGLQAVIEQFEVRRIWFNGTFKAAEQPERLFETALRRRIPLYAAHAGQVIPLDRHTSLEMLHPDGDPNSLAPTDRQNESSVVFRLNLYQSSFLFTGDIDAAAEQRIVKRRALRETEPPAIDVLKVAHHGSKTSTTDEWLSYWRPRAAVISVGAANRYGHPSGQVLERLSGHGIPVWRTDQDGEVQFRIGPEQIWLRTRRP
jgi:competence protein ComEC